MVKVLKKLIPVLIAAIIALSVVIVFNLAAREKKNGAPEQTAGPVALATDEPAGSPAGEGGATPGFDQTEQPAASPTEAPTATPEPSFSATVVPKLGGAAAGNVKLELSGTLIEAKYPYDTKESSLSSLTLSIGGENIGSAEFKSDGFVPWEIYPVKITDTAGLSQEYSFRIVPDGKNIPVLSIYTDGPVENRIDYVNGKIYVNGDNTEAFAGKNIDGATLRIRGRGNASWDRTDKKSYRIKLDEKASVLGLKKDRDWVLVSNYYDKTLLRNVVAHSMAQQMDHLYYTPTHILVDFFLNGKYMGVYAIADKIEESNSKVDVYNGTNPEEPGFMIEIGWDYSQPYVRDRDYFDTELLIRLFVKEPEITAQNTPELLYIKDYLKKTEDAILAGEGYEEYIDVDNMVDWFIITELTNNTEMAFYRSCYLYKPEGGRITMGPVWDFDMAFGNHEGDISNYDGWASAEATYSYVNDTWTTYLIKDPKFMDKVRARWIEVRDRLLETAKNTIDTQYALVKESADLNFKLWNIIDQKVGLGRVDHKKYNTYELQIEFLREFIIKRAAWIDKRLGV